MASGRRWRYGKGKRREEERETDTKKNGREPYIKLKLLTFKDGSATTVFEIFIIFTILSPLYKRKWLLNDRCRYCIVKKSLSSSVSFNNILLILNIQSLEYETFWEVSFF